MTLRAKQRVIIQYANGLKYTIDSLILYKFIENHSHCNLAIVSYQIDQEYYSNFRNKVNK